MIIKQNGYDVEYSDDGKMLVKCPPSFSGEFVVPDPVTEIGEDAFEGCTGLTGITFPEPMTEIGFIAFYGCTGLKAIEFH